MFPSASSNGTVNDESTAAFVSKFKVAVDNGQTAEFDSHDHNNIQSKIISVNVLISNKTSETAQYNSKNSL